MQVFFAAHLVIAIGIQISVFFNCFESTNSILEIKERSQVLSNLFQGSPFSVRVAGQPDPSRVKVYGPGVEHGVLAVYQSRFICDTRGAGAGQLTVRIRGPKGNVY